MLAVWLVGIALLAQALVGAAHAHRSRVVMPTFGVTAGFAAAASVAVPDEALPCPICQALAAGSVYTPAGAAAVPTPANVATSLPVDDRGTAVSVPAPRLGWRSRAPPGTPIA